MSSSRRHKLCVYTRIGCPLCEDMLLALTQLADSPGVSIEVFDIDEDAELKRRYDTRVPVLTCDGAFVCEYFLDPVALENMLESDSNPLPDEL